jgi:hypothetical protein
MHAVTAFFAAAKPVCGAGLCVRVCVCVWAAGDALGNIALMDINGKELWERHVKSMITQVRLRR